MSKGKNVLLVRVHRWNGKVTEFIPEEGITEAAQSGGLTAYRVLASASKVLNIKLGFFGRVREVWLG